MGRQVHIALKGSGAISIDHKAYFSLKKPAILDKSGGRPSLTT